MNSLLLALILLISRWFLYIQTVNQVFTCNKCKKQYTSKSGITQHMQVHTGRYSYYCDICRRGFIGKTAYDRHTRGHAGLKYHCEYCSKPFMSKEKLGFHLSVHTGQYKFRCEKCRKGFNKKYVFNSHTLTHTSENWYIFHGNPFCYITFIFPKVYTRFTLIKAQYIIQAKYHFWFYS